MISPRWREEARVAAIDETRKDQRVNFLIAAGFGVSPVLAHLVVALAILSGVVTAPDTAPISEQNWCGHLIFAGLSIAAGVFVNMLKHGVSVTRPGRICGFLLITFSAMLWLLFGMLAVARGAPSIAMWVSAVLVVGVVVLCAYILDMQIAVAQAG